MSSFWNFAFGAILVLIWIIAGGFITQANVFLGPYNDDDDYLHDAYWYSFWAAFITWTLIGIFIILVILSVIGVVALFGTGVGEAGAAAEAGVAAEGIETEEIGSTVAKSKKGKGLISTGVSWLTIAFLIFALILISITGVLSALTASSMVKSPNYDSTNDKMKTAYTDSIVAASMCLGAGGLLIIGIIVYFIIGQQRKKKIQQQKELVAKEKALEKQEIQQLKRQSLQQKAAQKAAFQQQLQQAEQAAMVQKVYQAAATPP